MKARKLKIAMLSKHVYASWGDTIKTKILESLPKGTVILEQQPNFERACLDMMVFNEKFPEVSLGEELPRVVLDIPVNTEALKPKIAYNH